MYFQLPKLSDYKYLVIYHLKVINGLWIPEKNGANQLAFTS
jgi:hypothetical protein